METELKKKYCNITREIINTYLDLCDQCQLKKKRLKREFVARRVLSDCMKSRGHVNIIDMQSESDGQYRFIMNYQDHLTKFTILRPLRTTTADEVAGQLLDIFSMFGAPCILHSDNGREFAREIIKRLAAMWPGLKLVDGKPHPAQSLDSVEGSNLDVRVMVVTWMAANESRKWSACLPFIQIKKNEAIHGEIKTSPYKAMFGSAQKNGLSDSPLSPDVYSLLETEEELETLVNVMRNVDDEVNEEYTASTDGDDSIKVEVNEQFASVKSEPESEDWDHKEDVINYCPVCGDETSGVHKCSECDQYVHVDCGEDNAGVGLYVTCKLCLSKNSISVKEESLQSDHEQLPDVSTGANVVLRLSDAADPERRTTRNILAVVTEVASSGLYRLGTKDGPLEQLYARSEFIVIENDLIQLADVPSSSTLTLGAAPLLSVSNQSVVSCRCTRYCIGKRCKCVSKNMKCSSKCHSRNSCKNK